MKIAIGSDHGGFEHKKAIITHLKEIGYDVDDIGVYSTDSKDYPDIAAKVSDDVVKNQIMGIAICGTGIGMSIAANKCKGIRAALCYDKHTAKMAREHNDANVLCIGGRTTPIERAMQIVDTFISTHASTEERHRRRIQKIGNLEGCN